MKKYRFLYFIGTAIAVAIVVLVGKLMPSLPTSNIISGLHKSKQSQLSSIATKIREIGAKADTEAIKKTLSLYAPLHAADNNDDLSVVTDQAYGDHKLQKLDVFAPEDAKELTVLVFTHGGGFTGGDKSNSHNIGRWAARNNMIGVTINYRLAPKVKWPEGAKDLALALAWIKNNIFELGGDPTKIVVAGESAGSIHTADYIFREELQINNDGVIGAVLISLPTTDREAVSALNDRRNLSYFDPNGDQHLQSLVNFVDGRKIPVLIAYSEFEPDFILDQTLLLIEAIARRDGSKTGRRTPLVTSAAGHNHISISQHIGTEDQTLAPDILEFINSLERDN